MNVNAFTDPRFIDATRRRALVLGRLGDPLDATPEVGGYAFQPVAGTAEYWHVSSQPGPSATTHDITLPTVRGLLVLQEINGVPVGVATDTSAFVPLGVSTSDHIGQIFHAILRRRFGR